MLFRPKVSVLIPSYNHGKYIEKTVQSVLNQTYSDYEIIITDDGSSDDTMEKLSSFKDSRVRIFKFEKNQGASETYNFCISKARGRFLANLSSDDLWYPSKLEKQVHFLNQNPDVESVFSWATIIDENDVKIDDQNHPYVKIFQQSNRDRSDWLRHFFLYGNCLCHPSVLTRRGIYDRTQLRENRMRQLPDFNLWVRICLEKNIHIFQEPLISFRIHQNQGNTSSSNFQNQIRLENECRLIYEHYLQIQDSTFFQKIFPESMQLEKFRHISDLKFQILLMFINGPTHSHKIFGIDNLYRYYALPKVQSRLKEQGFFPKDLYEISGIADSGNYWSIEKWKSLALDPSGK